MKKLISLLLLLACILGLAACGSSIGSVSGAENEHITINGVQYVLDTDNAFSSADRGEYLGKVSNDNITMDVYSVKGDTNGAYIFARWDWEGAFYQRQED